MTLEVRFETLKMKDKIDIDSLYREFARLQDEQEANDPESDFDLESMRIVLAENINGVSFAN